MLRYAITILVCLLGAIGPAPSWGSDPVAAETAVQLFTVYSGRLPKSGHYAPSGYMGDNDLRLSGAYVPAHEGSGSVLKVTYEPRGSKGWSGIYWQQPANNWGERSGHAGYDLRGAKKLMFWARGEAGQEKIREIKIGGITGKYPDSDVKSFGPIQLTKEWKPYSVDLSGKDLQHIIGGFSIIMNKYDNPGKATFYLDDIVYDVPLQTVLPQVASSMTEKTPVATGVEPELKDLNIKEEPEGLRVSLSAQLLFGVGKSGLAPEAGTVLHKVVEVLNAYPSNKVLVEGHTDSTGASATNLALSRKRAETVRDYLVKNGKFDSGRFTTVGYGHTRPVADNATRQGRSKNRRVEVIILKAEKK
jgi:outer membrane protein OmpA-like peptidoglycan-associated protein